MHGTNRKRATPRRAINARGQSRSNSHYPSSCQTNDINYCCVARGTKRCHAESDRNVARLTLESPHINACASPPGDVTRTHTHNKAFGGKMKSGRVTHNNKKTGMVRKQNNNNQKNAHSMVENILRPPVSFVQCRRRRRRRGREDCVCGIQQKKGGQVYTHAYCIYVYNLHN